MKSNDAHLYELDNVGGGTQRLQFISKIPKADNPKELATAVNGTTNEEVISALIDRLEYLNAKFPCRENSLAITKLQEANFWLSARTADRKHRNVEGKNMP
jgi:hypothetical protein